MVQIARSFRCAKCHEIAEEYRKQHPDSSSHYWEDWEIVSQCGNLKTGQHSRELLKSGTGFQYEGKQYCAYHCFEVMGKKIEVLEGKVEGQVEFSRHANEAIKQLTQRLAKLEERKENREK